MVKNVCIVHFNTPELTSAAIKSIKRVTPDCNITVFDNSDSKPFPKTDGVQIIDNTKSQVIDFKEFLDRYPDRLRTTANDWGSAKHCYTVQKLWDYFPDGFVLMDSDIIVKKDFSCFFDESVAFSGEEHCNPKNVHKLVPRLLPFICWINVKMCRENGVRYFDEKRCWKLGPSKNPHDWYDTGASFLEDCKKISLPSKQIKIFEYIEHLGSGSWIGTPYKAWLEKHKNYYEDMKTEDKQKDKYLVVIPYFAGGAQGREIEYAVAGWRKHFKEPYLIVVVGDYNPVVDTGDDIIHIKCERVGPQTYENYRTHIDFVKKFRAVRKEFPDSKGFIFVADDCYAVNDFDFWDVACLKQNGNSIIVPDLLSPWNREKNKTKTLLKNEGYPTRNFVTHLPLWYDWDKLEAMFDKYDMDHNSYILEDIYFNMYYPTRIPASLHIDHDNFKCGVYRKNPRLNYIENAFKTKIWIQNSVEGWIPYLDERLAKYYDL